MLRAIALALLAFASAAPSGADSQLAQYRVRLTLDGVWGPYNFEGCPASPGTEIIEGTVSGDESGLARNEPVSYTGVLRRKTNVDVCDMKQTSDGDDYCVTHLEGDSKVKLTIEINADRPGAWIKWRPLKDTATATVSGDCEAGLTNEIRSGYSTAHDIAEIPSVPAGRLVEGATHIDRGDRSSTKLEMLAARGLRAVPGGPYSPQRAETVTLNGSRSTPSSGHQIQTYTWRLTPLGTPQGCAGIGRETTKSGATVTFVALCSVRAELTVAEDGGEEDVEATEVTVRPRSWKSKLTTDPVVRKEKSFTFVANGRAFGYNRCRRDGHFDEESNHWYEPRPGSVNDFETGSFWLDEVADDGPFAGVQFVSKGDFALDRATWVNKRFYSGGDVFEMNPGAALQVESCPLPSGSCPFGAPVFGRLRTSVETHEMTHSTLAEKALAALQDPAPEVERLMGPDRDQLATAANDLIGGANSTISNASTENLVKAELRRKYPALVPGGCIDFPDWDGAVRRCYYRFQSFVDR